MVLRTTFGINKFFKRHTAKSKYSYFSGSEQDLINLVEQNFPLRRPGNRDGTWVVPIPTTQNDELHFFSAVVQVSPHMLLNAECIAKRGEKGLIAVSTIGQKQLGLFVEIVLWSKELLIQTSQQSTKNDYELVSLNVSDVPNPPEHPYEIMRQVLDDGKESKFTVEDICKAIAYWGERAFVKPKFTRHIDKLIADFIKAGEINKAFARRREICPDESDEEINVYIQNAHNFMIETGNYYI